MPSHFHHNLGNINKKEPCCNHQSGCDSQKATECELFNTPHNFWVCALKSRYSEQVHHHTLAILRRFIIILGFVNFVGCWNFSSSTIIEIVKTTYLQKKKKEDMEETRFKRKYIKWIGCSTCFQHIAERIYYFSDKNFKKVTIYPD